MKKVIYATLLVAITMISCKDNKNSTTEPSQEVAVIEANTEASLELEVIAKCARKPSKQQHWEFLV